MRIRPSLRLACAAAACALALGLAAASPVRAQSLIEALSTTYNSNPDLLAQRALLRQTDETLAQAVANWRPRVSLSVEYNKIEHELAVRAVRAGHLLRPERPDHAAVGDPADLPRRQDGGRHQGGAGQHPGPARAARRTPSRTVLLQAANSYADLLRDVGIVDVRKNNVRVLVQQLDATRERFRVGELTITDVSQAEARLEQAKADLVQAEAAGARRRGGLSSAPSARSRGGWARSR